MRDVASLESIDAGSLLRWGLRARALLRAERSRLDSLNVFPVPDGDTGTNLVLTLGTALDALLRSWSRTDDPPPAEVLDRLAHECLLAARGNSGVILSQLVAGLAETTATSLGPGEPADHPRSRIGGAELALGLRRASDRARHSVTHPVEGTILTVACAAADAAADAAHRSECLAEVTAAAVEGARAALASTPAQLPALAQAGVVDAGGAGLLVILGALLDVVLGRESPSALGPDVTGAPGIVAAAAPGAPSLAADRYEVIYRLAGCPDPVAARLREHLDAIGDSVVIAGDDDTRTVHVHTGDIGAAIEAGYRIGHPLGLRVEQLVAQPRQPRPDPATARRRAGAVSPTLGIVACACGPGLARTFAAAGAVVVPDAPASRATPAAVLEAIRRTGAGVVVVLANDADTVMAAEATAGLAEADGILVRVAARHSPVQGIAALAVLDPHADPHECAQSMCEAAAAARTGMVAVATSRARTAAGWCQIGDVLGVVGDDAVLVGADPVAAAAEVVSRMLADGGELVTLVGGQGHDGLVDDIAARLADVASDVEVATFADGHPVYALLVGVE